MVAILIEGLDGTGKTTTVKMLSEHFNSKIIKTPPEFISHLRNYCTKLKPNLREVYYNFGNFICSEEIKENKKNYIIIDRYYPSTYSYIYGKDLNISTDIEVKFPIEIEKPDYMFVLIIDEKERLKRLIKRGDMNEEEVLISQNNLISERINTFYLKFGCVPIYINNDDSPNDVLNKILKQIN